jgi:hypothetical protein
MGIFQPEEEAGLRGHELRVEREGKHKLPFGRRCDGVENAGIGNTCFRMVGDELIAVCGDSYARVARCGGHDFLREGAPHGEVSLDIAFVSARQENCHPCGSHLSVIWVASGSEKSRSQREYPEVTCLWSRLQIAVSRSRQIGGASRDCGSRAGGSHDTAYTENFVRADST